MEPEVDARGREPRSRASGLPLDAVVVRAGMCKPRDLANAALTYHAIKRSYGITVWSWPGMTATEIAMRARHDAEAAKGKNPIPHALFRSATVRSLLMADSGFRLVKTGPPGHYTLLLPMEPQSGETWTSGDDVMHSSGIWVLDLLHTSILGTSEDNPAKGAIG